MDRFGRELERIVERQNNFEASLQTPRTVPTLDALSEPAPTRRVTIEKETKHELETFDGKPEKFSGFIAGLKLYFAANNLHYQTDQKKIEKTVFKCSAEVRDWYVKRIEAGTEPKTWDAFEKEFTILYGLQNEREVATNKIESLKQTKSCREYTVEFRKYMAKSGFNDHGLTRCYRKGLKPNLQQMLIQAGNFDSVELMMKEAIRLDDDLWALTRDANQINKSKNPGSTKFENQADKNKNRNHPYKDPSKNNKQIKESFNGKKRGPITPEERQRRLDNKLCLYCGEKDHTAVEHRPGGKLFKKKQDFHKGQ
jgi:hypothetical protein